MSRPLLVHVTLLACLACFAAPVAAEKTHLFILSGQSNMAGLDPNVSFTPTVSKALQGDKVIVVKSAQGGQPMHRWYKQWKSPDGKPVKPIGDLYDVMMKKVEQAVGDAQPDTVTFIWMQGERDARMGWGGVYAAALRGLIDQLSADLKRDDVNFVIGRLSDFSNGNAKYRHWDEVRAAQVKVAEASPRGAWVNTDDLNDKENDQRGKWDDLHLTKDGYKTLGERFADKALALLKKEKK